MTCIDLARLAAEYAEDRTAVRRCAERHGISIQAVYYQMDRMGIKRRVGGDATKGTQARELNSNWVDGKTIRKDGYILQYVDGRQLFQHRLVAEAMLGRPLQDGECVHHKNGNPSDNRPENLEVMKSHSEHMKHHCDPAVMSERGIKGNQKRWHSALKARASIREVQK